MKFAPVGVFSLVFCALIDVGSKSNNLGDVYNFMWGVSAYALLVISALSVMIFVAYPLLVSIFTNVGGLNFLRAMRPAQLTAFSTSSSSATLPVTLKQVQNKLNVPKEIASFVLPLGATVNMDGTAIYQGIAAMFIAQAYGVVLTFEQQLTIITYVTVSSIGVAGVPGASITTTSILLSMLNLPAEGISLIIIFDRILDMFRTVANVTGDAAVAVVIGANSTEEETKEIPLIQGEE